MPFPLPASAVRAAAAALAWVVVASTAPLARAARAQSPHDDADQMERVEVSDVRFRGVKSVNLGELREVLATQPSHCLGAIQKPFCLFTKSPHFYERRYLDREEFRRDVVRLLVFYYRRGWRDAKVDTAVTQTGPKSVRIDFDVTEGEPTRVDTIAVALPPGSAALPRRGQGRGRGRGGLRPRPGEPLNLLELDSSVVRLRSNLWNRGYGDAVVDKPEIAVDDSANRARVRIAVRPGPLTPIANVSVVHLRPDHQVSDETIRNSLTFEPGDLFKRSEVARSQRLLYESNLFRSAVIDTGVARDAATGRAVCAQQGTAAPTPEARAAAAAKPDSTKSIVVCVLEGTLREARVSAGFTTVDFLQVEGQYTHNYWLGGARQLNVNAAVGNLGAEQLYNTFPFNLGNANGYVIGGDVQDQLAQTGRYFAPTYQVGGEVRQRWFRSPRNTIAVGGFAHRRASPAVYVDRGYGGSMTFTRNLAARAPLSATYRFELARVEASDVYFCTSFGVCDAATIDALQGQQRLSPLALTLSSSTADDPLSPGTGYIARAEAQHASSATLSDFHFNRVLAEASVYRRLGFGSLAGGPAAAGRRTRRPVLAGRVRVGWVQALSGTNAALNVTREMADFGEILHPRTRFYAGGSQSVRGFDENQLGPRVLTISQQLLRIENVSGKDTTFRCPPTVPVAQCDVNVASLPDRDFIPRPLGGTSLLEGGIELRVPVWGPLSTAFFIDGAIVGEKTFGDFANASSAITPGFGVRYLSPVGPVRVDIGLRPKLVEDLAVITEEILPDGTRHLVPIGTRRYGDNTEKGLKGFFSRLSLHLSIGEAF